MSPSSLRFPCFYNQDKPEKSSATCRSNFVQNLVNCIIRIENSTSLFSAKSRNLIGTGGISKFGPKQGQGFQRNTMSLYQGAEHLVSIARSAVIKSKSTGQQETHRHKSMSLVAGYLKYSCLKGQGYS